MSGGGKGGAVSGMIPGVGTSGNRADLADLLLGFNGASLAGSIFPNAGLTKTTPAQTTLPNLGASTLIPQMPSGAFLPTQGGGGYNGMAQQAAGPLYNPSVTPTGTKGGIPVAMMKNPPNIRIRH